MRTFAIETAISTLTVLCAVAIFWVISLFVYGAHLESLDHLQRMTWEVKNYHTSDFELYVIDPIVHLLSSFTRS